ncbi:hypothetical protein [Winogradskyella luteola]|uniref:Uncharacterized protein n=1 Tax=Winogradskyella luteola TaxID=2828330 RepID=A0A9X1F7R4_9FLAO|nr:hypothetical protein [Winogradskyella luteola]MBV7268183.1 hypothetical protein [Winogradskyella luteola]
MKTKTIITSFLRVMAIVLTLVVLMPSAVKLLHALNHHKHEVCKNDNNGYTHFHETDLDCDFYKFKLTKNQYFLVYDYDESFSFLCASQSLSYYISLNNHQHLTRHLRGPPSLV